MNEIPSNPSNNEALLQELALRLLTSPWDPHMHEPQLLVGQIPVGLPVDLPLPQDNHVLGSLLRSSEQAEILLDTPLPPERVIDFYREQMQVVGWYEPSSAQEQQEGGFTHTGLPSTGAGALFCQGARGPSLSITTLQGKRGLTDVRLTFNMSRRNSPCTQRSSRWRDGQLAQNLIPPLKPPTGAQQMGGGGGSSQDRADTSATLETATALPILELAAHYAVQLEKAGWTRTDDGHSGPLAWHAWRFQDDENEPWQGLFFVMKLLGTERRYFLYIEIHMSDA